MFSTSTYRCASALCAVCLLGSLGVEPATAADTESFWINPGDGDWSDPANWSFGLPDFTNVGYINNGGTATLHVPSGESLHTSAMRVGWSGTGGMVRTGAGTYDSSNLVLGFEAGDFGSYIMAGSGASDFRTLRVGLGGTGFLGLRNGTVSSYLTGVSSGSRVNHTGGSLRVDNLMAVIGEYDISGLGSIDANVLRVEGQFEQSGGDVYTDSLVLDESGLYLMTGGTYESPRTGLVSGAFELHGGVATTGRLEANSAFRVYGGELNLNGPVFGNSLRFLSGDWTVNVHETIIDFTQGGLPTGFVDLSGGTFNTVHNSLILLPASLDTSRFLSYNPAGLVHVPGQTLVIPADRFIQGDRGELSDHVVVEGTLSAGPSVSQARGNITLLEGIEVKPGGRVNLGNGELIINNQVSRMEGEALYVEELSIGGASPGRFVHTQGLIDKDNATSGGFQMNVGYGSGARGVYEIYPGASLRAEDMFVGILGGEGHVIQHGGDVLMTYTTFSFVAIGEGGLYELNGGTLRTTDTLLGGDIDGGTARFIQRGGVHTTDDVEIGEGNGGSAGVYELLGGQHDMRGIQIGRRPESVGTYIVDGGTMNLTRVADLGNAGTATLEVRSGSASIANVEASTIAGQSVTVKLVGGGTEFGDVLLGGYDSGHSGIIPSAGAVSLEVRPGATVRVTERLTLMGLAELIAEPGSRIGFVGADTAVFELLSEDESALADMNHLTLSFVDGFSGGHEIEIGGADLGFTPDGLVMNFALHALLVGDGAPGSLRLIDEVDNQLDGLLGNEALYVQSLNVGPGSVLDLNGLTLYYDFASIDPTATIELNGGQLLPVPEPASGVLVLFAATVAAMNRRRQMSATFAA